MVYINHLDTLTEDLNIRFGDLSNVHVPDWVVTQFYTKIDNKGYESDINMILLKRMCTSKLMRC